MIDLSRVLPYRSVLGRIVRTPLRFVSSRRVVSIKFGDLRGTKWVVGAGIHGCWLGTYEWDKQRRLAQRLSAGMVVYDIGAHAGFYSLLASRLVGVRGRVYAFEPAPENLTALERHVALNRAQNVIICPWAVGASDGAARFKAEGTFTGMIHPDGRLDVEVRALDTLVDGGEIAPADVVKIDVEGAELEVLVGGTRFFRVVRPTIFLATHGAEVHRSVCSLLRGWGYRLGALRRGETLEATDEVVAES